MKNKLEYKSSDFACMYDDFSVQGKFNTCKNDFKKFPLAFVRPYFVIDFSYVHGIA